MSPCMVHFTIIYIIMCVSLNDIIAVILEKQNKKKDCLLVQMRYYCTLSLYIHCCNVLIYCKVTTKIQRYN